MQRTSVFRVNNGLIEQLWAACDFPYLKSIQQDADPAWPAHTEHEWRPIVALPA
jgi:hypothetical protein